MRCFVYNKDAGQELPRSGGVRRAGPPTPRGAFTQSAAGPPRLDSPAAGSGFRVQLDDLQIYPTRVPPQGAAAPEPCEGAGCLASVQAPAGGNEDQVVAAFLPGSSPIIPLFGENVCGLHIAENMQYLTKVESSIKGSKFDGTPENKSWRKDFRRRVAKVGGSGESALAIYRDPT